MVARKEQVLGVALFLTLILWGGYTFLSYLGVPVHGAVLLPPEDQALVKEICGEGQTISILLCRGWYSFAPFLWYTVLRAEPFFLFFTGSALTYLLFLGWSWGRTRSLPQKLSLSPWKLSLLFCGLVWLLLVGFGFGSDAGQPVRRIVEPNPEVYTNVKDRTLAVLQENFERLQGDGCLAFLGYSSRGSGVYQMRQWCMQRAFVTRVVPLFLLVLLLSFEWLILGRVVLSLFRFAELYPFLEFVLSAGVGVGGWIVILWSLAVFHILTAPVVWGLFLLVPFLFLRHAAYWIRRFLFAEWVVPFPWKNPTCLLGWLLLSYLALNFLVVVRPFPIGWDDLGSYLNRSRLLVSYGHFIFSMAPFQWEYLTSLGFLLFGYDSVFGTTASLMVNWSAGLLAILSIIAFVRVFLRSGGLLSALLYYALPLVGHFSFADMKVDNAVFAMGALSGLCMFLFLFHSVQRNLRWMALAGVFAGFAFGLKPTAIMGILTWFLVLVGATLHWSSFFSAFFLTWALYVWRNVLDLPTLFSRLGLEGGRVSRSLIGGVLASIGIVFLLPSLRSPLTLRQLLLRGAVFSVSAFLTILPWVWHNNIQKGRIVPTELALGAPNTVTPIFHITADAPTVGPNIRALPPAIAVDRSHPACSSPTGHREEVDRYWGLRQGWRHYITLPWRTVMNIDSAGYYVTTMPALLLFPLLLLLPFFWSADARWFRWLWLGTAFFVMEWVFLTNGIPWYGVGVFLGLCIALEVLYRHAPDRVTRGTVVVLLTLSLLTCFANRFWQFSQMRNLIEYPLGKASAAVMRERTIPYYDNIRDIVLQLHDDNPHRPYLYRVGTFIPYFIPRNLEIIPISDHQLDFFSCLNQEKDHTLTLKRLQHLGFHSIIFDTNTATIERDLQGTLHQKVQAFVDFLNDSSQGFRVVVNDLEEGVAFVILP